MDVRLDAGANQLYVAVDGYGVYAAIAPHRFRDARVVNAADYSGRSRRPRIASQRPRGGRHFGAGGRHGGSGVGLRCQRRTDPGPLRRFRRQHCPLAPLPGDKTIAAAYPLRDVSPAIFVDPDGTPMILDADSGEMLDASKPARSGARIQILATGLGRVDPAWPTGAPGPSVNPPRVVAPLRAYLDQRQIEIGRAVLAPYVGFYLIEIELPRIVNAGPAELYVEAAGQPSNHVRLYIEP